MREPVRLLLDRRAALQGQPGCHALLVGVSAYPHLLGGSGPIASETFGLPQLSAAVASAVRIYEWLLQHQDGMAAPLATCRMLVSPSAAEPSPQGDVEPATLENFLRVAAAWRADAVTQRAGIAFFYFAGHGFELGPTEQVMLLADFGNGIGPLLRGTISVNNLFYGMAPSARAPNIARTQVYCIDTGRHHPTIPNVERLNTTAVFDADPATLDDRAAAVFYAAASGGDAFAIPGQQSLFSEALLECLNGGAATTVGENDDQEPIWGVTLYSLAEALPRSVDELSARLGADQRVTVGGSLGPAVLRYTDGPPTVNVSLRIHPEEAVPHARVTVVDAQEHERWTNAGQRHPYELALPAGSYSVRVLFPSSTPPYVERASVKFARPPRAEWRVKVV